MLLKPTLIIPLLLLSSMIYGQLLIMIPEKENLKGKVKSYTELSFEAIEHLGNIEKGKKIVNSWKYDVERKYDKYGKQIEWYGYKSDGSLYIKYTYKYDEHGNSIEENWSNSDGTLKMSHTYEYKYDINGNMVEKMQYDSDGSLFHTNTYQYDSNGNQIEVNQFDSYGNLDEIHFYNYDEHGNRIEEKLLNSAGIVYMRHIYKYDDSGNKIEWNSYTDDILNGKSTYSYDENGNKIIEKRYGPNGELRSKKTYRYDYDERGNWIKKTIIEDDTAKTILERKYEYYK